MIALRRFAGPLLAVGAALFPLTPRAEEKSIAYGKHLSAECSGCHRLDGSASNIPSIIGRPAEEIRAAIKEFQAGKRTNTTMVSVAQSLDDAQIAALAAYLGTLAPRK